MKIAVVGSGISGLVCAWLLDRSHEVTLFESDLRLGGHTNTVECKRGDRSVPVDTGFIVYNERNYPAFTRLLGLLDVQSQPAPMSFGLRCERTGLEYGGASLGALFAQGRNLFSPTFWRLLADIVRFGREAGAVLEGSGGESLGAFLARRGYSRGFVESYLVPMGAAIWSSPPGRLRDFPVRDFARFFANHGMLDPRRAPQWRTIRGGAKRYVDAMLASYRGRIRSGCGVRTLTRRAGAVELDSVSGDKAAFDAVILAVHSDQALRLLASPTPAEREILGAIPYQANEAILHVDSALLPRARRAWSGWNYHRLPEDGERVAVTYDLSILQSIPGDEHFLVTLNHADAIDPSKVLARIGYDHPAFGPSAFAAQARKREISGVGNVHYAGAYWGFGFHEDGVQSALDACAAFGVSL